MDIRCILIHTCSMLYQIAKGFMKGFANGTVNSDPLGLKVVKWLGISLMSTGIVKQPLHCLREILGEITMKAQMPSIWRKTRRPYGAWLFSFSTHGKDGSFIGTMSERKETSTGSQDEKVNTLSRLLNKGTIFCKHFYKQKNNRMTILLWYKFDPKPFCSVSVV